MRSDEVAIFWDYENCHAGSHVSGYEIVRKIRHVAHELGTVKLFKAYLELSESAANSKSINLRSELQLSGVSLTDCPHNGRKDVADKMMLVDMLAYAIDNPAPTTIILISGDRDFAYAVSILRLRRYRVVIISLGGVHVSLRAHASIFLDWNTDVLGMDVAKQTTCTVEPRIESCNGLNAAGTPHRVRSRSHAKDNSIDTMDNLSPKSTNARPVSGDTTDAPTTIPQASSFHYTNHDKTPVSTIDESRCTTPTFRAPSRTESAPASVAYSIASPQPPANESVRYHDTFQPNIHAVINDNLRTMSPTMPTFSQNPKSPRNESTVLGALTSISPPSSNPFNTGVLANPLSSVHPLSPSQSPVILSPSNGVMSPTTTPVEVPSQPLNPRVVPTEFKLLVEKLDYHRSKGYPRPFRSGVAVELATHDNTLYRSAGVERFGQYVALAEKAGIVELGGKEGMAWIGLRPEWYGAT